MRRSRVSSQHKRPQIRLFECNECGTRIVAPKYKRVTKVGHVKTMYCYRCKKYTDQTQIE